LHATLTRDTACDPLRLFATAPAFKGAARYTRARIVSKHGEHFTYTIYNPDTDQVWQY